VVAASLGGGFLGDAVGYWIGRRGGNALRERPGFVGDALRRYDRQGGRFVSGHPLFSVTGARLVAFVRTVMPVATGASRLPFAVYLLYEIPGLLLWFAMYAGIGFLAGESIERAGAVVGGLWLVVFSVVGVTLWVRRRLRSGAKGLEEGAT
jgi:membrane protein DedA with SNARE-associated domain